MVVPVKTLFTLSMEHLLQLSLMVVQATTLSIAGLSGTSSVMGGAGADSITVGGNTTQWLIDAGADADSLYITSTAERTTVLGGRLTVSTSVLFLRALFSSTR